MWKEGRGGGAGTRVEEEGSRRGMRDERRDMRDKERGGGRMSKGKG